MRKKTTASRPADSMISSSEGFQARVTHPGDGSSVWMENGSLSFTSFRWSRSIWRVEYTPAFPGWFRNIEYKIKKIVASPILIPAEVARSEISITPAPKPNPLLFSSLESLYTNFLLVSRRWTIDHLCPCFDDSRSFCFLHNLVWESYNNYNFLFFLT